MNEQEKEELSKRVQLFKDNLKELVDKGLLSPELTVAVLLVFVCGITKTCNTEAAVYQIKFLKDEIDRNYEIISMVLKDEEE